MAVIKQIVGARTTLTVTGLSTLPSATYVASNSYTCNTNQPIDVLLEVGITTTNTPAGNKQVVVFVQTSLDGTNYSSGPVSGTVTTDEANLIFVGYVPTNTISVTQTKIVSIFGALGYVPYAFRVILKNDLGVALTGGTVFTSEISNTVA